MPADIIYDMVTKRWVITGSDEKPRQYIPDNQSLITRVLKFVGSTPAIGVGTGGMAIATMEHTQSLDGTEVVFVSPMTALTLSLAYARCSGDVDIIKLGIANPNQVVATQAALGWRVTVIRGE